MNKPKPRKEIAIKKRGNALVIHCVTPDAITAVVSEAGEFGSFTSVGSDSLVLHVMPNYDVDEVVKYIEALGN